MSFLVKKTKTRKVKKYSYSFAQKKRVVVEPSNRRIKILMVFFLFISTAIVLRLIRLQIFDGAYYYALASDQHEIFQQLYPERGTIFVKEKDYNGVEKLYPIATNRELTFVYAVPSSIDDPEELLNSLLEVLDFSDEIKKYQEEVTVPMSEELTAEQVVKEKRRLELMAEEEATDLFKAKMLERLRKKDDPYEPIKHRVSDEKIEKLKNYNLSGLRFVAEDARYYPEGNMGSNLLGFVGHTSENNLLKGYYGVEGNYNDYLAGEAGFIRSESDVAGRWIAMAGKEFKEAKDGSDLVLTIDKAIQYYVCEQLLYGIENFAADSGSIIVMDPKTGAILAMCSYPDYDPDEYNKVEDISVFNNPALLATYEPGSIFKPMTMAAAIDKGKITPFTTYVDKGVEHIAGYDIRNSDLKAHGLQTMTQVLESSLNTGTIFASRQIGIDVFADYMKLFGFGRITDIDLSPEAEGNFSSLDKKHELYMATASFGQGITVSPIQMVRAYGALANEGKLMKPYVVDRIITEDKVIVTEPKVMSQVVSARTAQQVGSMMVSVVENGHADLARVPGYLVAGKTGTAQEPDWKNGGYSDQTIHSFIGYAPYDDPAFVMLVKLDHVKNVQYSASSAAPVFGKIAKFILDYYEIPPSVR
ncbi:hypothetical protein COT97_01720 [Candidatus Falkowbacteria bacterium CG10_big_fil_rev_8_21_14_0_10_39_11]|uniref:Penicillin-binding protein 2 n=1 Tax=Candidatus Falkowbacteria bacterium CG10_big_fil_rev_8_21_14_0_10_39_11 TaxID=1974565 RepID=A0A2H0V5L7_9BACT|nr:MAG: hypothetical protein COT97_01720 [Candidatus Falkowbacteria bacterium CG10_big_fil_rev_8_21_14_0_10_39_11]